MKGLHVDVGAFDRALEQTPEIFESVGVNLSVTVPLSMVNDLVDVFLFKTVVGGKRVGEHFRALEDVFAHIFLSFDLAAIPHHLQNDAGAPVVTLQ